MKKQTVSKYIKTKVVIDFDNEQQAKAFFNLFDNPSNENGLKLLKSLPQNIDVKKIANTKELKHNYLVKIV